jgi:hypothetical protein
MNLREQRITIVSLLHCSDAGVDSLKKRPIKKAARIPADHPMVGVWEEDPGKRARTTVVYTISVKHGAFAVRGKDGDGGTAVKISNVRWDGSSLSFTSFYPRNQHTANVVFRFRARQKLRCEVSSTYFDAEPFHKVEVWTRKRSS